VNAGGEFKFRECVALEHEKQIEGKYVIATAEKSLGVLNAVVNYKELADTSQRCALALCKGAYSCIPCIVNLNDLI
jgi:hypothetical protein